MTEAKKGLSLADIPDVKKFFEGASSSTAEKPSLPRQKIEKPIKKKKKVTEEADSPPVEAAAESDDIRPKTSVERYKDNLSDFGLSEEEAMEIIDALVTRNTYDEEVKITKKLSVRFRTRTSKAMTRLNRALDDSRPQYDAAYYTVIAQHNLASSLVEYGDYILDPDTNDGYEQSLAFIESLPGPLFAILTDKLNSFDQKISAVMKEGCIENF
jgi:hypothetical protein